ncbi:MAG TPA: ABC transporter substrate-binding protein, partial [Candidatus Binatia bacterium]
MDRRYRRHSIKLFLAVFTFLALQLAWPLPAVTAAAPAKLVVGYAAITARIMPLWIAQEQGFFVKYGIDSEPVFIRGGTTLVTGLASGDVQIGRTAGAAVLSAVTAGHDLKMLA